MHMLGVKIKNKTKEIAIFWVIRSIKYTSLKYGLCKSQNIKVDYKMDVLNKIMNFFKTKNILGKDQVRENNVCISMLSIKNYVRDQINLIDNRDKKKQIESICDGESFSFTYNSIAYKNLNFGHEIK